MYHTEFGLVSALSYPLTLHTITEFLAYASPGPEKKATFWPAVYSNMNPSHCHKLDIEH
jgi:hypothetical protein